MCASAAAHAAPAMRNRLTCTSSSEASLLLLPAPPLGSCWCAQALVGDGATMTLTSTGSPDLRSALVLFNDQRPTELLSIIAEEDSCDRVRASLDGTVAPSFWPARAKLT